MDSGRQIILLAEVSAVLYSVFSYRKILDGQAWANSVDPDQMPHNVASDQGLHRLLVTEATKF